MKRKYIITSAFFAILATTLASCGENFKPQSLTCGEFYTNPLGYDIGNNPVLSWKLPAGESGTAQTSYRISARSTRDGYVWDSGEVKSSQSVFVPYGGRAPVSGERFEWKVRVRDQNGKLSDWSETAFFEAGLLSNSDWKADWISTNTVPSLLYKVDDRDWRAYSRNGVAPTYLRKEIDVKRGLKRARMYVASLGFYEAYVNGKKTDDSVFGTGWTNYKKRVLSDTADITKLLKEGRNTLGAIIADGWYSGRISRRNGKCPKPEFLAQIVLEYEDGSLETVVTDASWREFTSAYAYADIFDGESYDARKEPSGWLLNGFDDSAWKNAAARQMDKLPLITPRRGQPVRYTVTLPAVGVREISKGVFVFDLAQNMAGVPEIRANGVAGKPVKIRFAEMLNEDGSLYTENYRSAISTDIYTPASDGVFTYRPKFTFHGFRYVEVSGLAPNWKPDLSAVVGCTTSSDTPATGSFACSNPKLTKLQSNIQWGQRGNFISVPTDCPQRDERMGWTGDAQIFCATAAFNMNVDAFFAKWCQDLRDSQKPNGAVPKVVPNDWGLGYPAWGDAAVICPWKIYLAYNDKKMLTENYDLMKGWTDYQYRGGIKRILSDDVGSGDWLQPSTTRSKDPNLWRGATPRPLIGLAYFIYDCDIMAKAAAILDKEADVKKYAALSAEAKAAFVREFVQPDGTVKGDCQTAYLLPLAFDILPQNMRAKCFEKLLATIERAGGRLDTGFVGTPLLNDVLVKFGRADVAYKIVTCEEYPSWIYSINQGATTIWERWNSYTREKGFGEASMNSFNHYAYGAIGSWLYKNIAGLCLDENAPGYANIIYAPVLGGGLDKAEASIETPYGTASSSWQIKNSVMAWTVVVPPNATGTITPPAKTPADVLVNGKKNEKFPVKVASGTYKIEVKIK